MRTRILLRNIIIGFLLGSQLAIAATTTRVSVNSLGNESKSDRVGSVAISANGRFVAFGSDASNLVPNDSNELIDVFVHDRQTGETTRVSVNSRGEEASAGGRYRHLPVTVAISADGRFVAFESYADNLVSDDTNDVIDVFVHDRQTGKTNRVSVNSRGQEGNLGSGDPAISASGRFVAFESGSRLVPNDTQRDVKDVFVHDRKTGKTSRVSVSSSGQGGNGDSGNPAISADGRFVAFSAENAGNLVDDDKNDERNVFVHDRKTGETTRVGVNSLGEVANGDTGRSRVAISGDGRFVTFESEASNLVPDDTNGDKDVFAHDRKTGKTTRVSVNSLGQEANSDPGDESNVAISRDGRFVTFESGATNLVADDTNSDSDVFVHDRKTGKTTRVSVSSRRGEGTGGSGLPAISRKGRFVAFRSDAADLVTNDTNMSEDIFVADRDRDIVNERVTFEPNAKSFQMVSKARKCADGFTGRFLIRARLDNTGDTSLADLHMPIAKLTGGNKLVTASGLIGPNGEFPVPERGDYSDGTLSPGESVAIPLEVCLGKHKPFKLYVDVADDRKTKVNESAKPQAEFRFIVGLEGDDTLKGTNGDDMIVGFDGNDTVRGKSGNDLILGGRGDDMLFGNGDDDELRGNQGNDQLLGGNDDDLLLGGSGNDALDGGSDIDICKGGSGTNTQQRCEL